MTSSSNDYELAESRNHQAPAEPVAWKVKITPEPDATARSIIEQLALSRGFLQKAHIDPDDAADAVPLWHSDNGTRRSGPIKLRYYGGEPRNRSSETAVLETEGMVWCAKFKGALYGHDRKNDRHFVVYSPAWFYDWVDCLAWNGVLWFCDRNRSGLFCFEMISSHGSDARLSYYNRYDGKPLAHISKLAVENGVLIVDGDTAIDRAQLSEDKRPPDGLPPAVQ
ncbi:MAG: hypothetical protein ACYDEV_00340 [Acidiferrobacter sp.]